MSWADPPSALLRPYSQVHQGLAIGRHGVKVILSVLADVSVNVGKKKACKWPDDYDESDMEESPRRQDYDVASA